MERAEPTYYRLLLGLIGFTLIGILIWYFGLKNIYAQLAALEMRWVLTSLACLILSTCIGAINAYILLPQGIEITFPKFLILYWTAWAIGLVIPGQVGDVATIGVLLRKRVINIAQIMGRVVLDKAISLVLMVVFAIFGVMSLPGLVVWDLRALLWIVVVMVVGAVAIHTQRPRLSQIFDAGRPGLAGGIRRGADEFFRALRQHRFLVAININLTALKIGLTGLAYWAAFAALGHLELPWLQVAMLAVAAGLVAYLPLSINGFGTVEIAGIALFTQVGLSAVTVLSAYLLLRAIVYTLAWVPAGIWLLLPAANRKALINKDQL